MLAHPLSSSSLSFFPQAFSGVESLQIAIDEDHSWMGRMAWRSVSESQNRKLGLSVGSVEVYSEDAECAFPSERK